MFHGACAWHQRDLEDGKGEEGLPHLIQSPNLTTGYRKNNETRSCDYSKAKQSGSISEVLRGYPVWGETMWW